MSLIFSELKRAVLMASKESYNYGCVYRRLQDEKHNTKCYQESFK